MGDYKKIIIKTISEISGRYSPYEVYTDWIRCSALSIANACRLRHDAIWKEREDDYIQTMLKYQEPERNRLRDMFYMLADALEDEISDVLGEIYMEARMGSKYTGQFFTPFHLSELCARMALQETISSFDGNEISLNEPSTGAGGMIIAAVKVLRDAGINPQKYLRVAAQDLDWKGVYMTYVQLSLLGIKAIVVQGDTLANPYTVKYPEERTLRTPAELGLLP